MRTSALLYIGILFSILTVGIVCVLTMKSSYAMDIRDNLDESIVQSVSMLQSGRVDSYEGVDGSIHHVPRRSIDWSDNMDSFKQEFVEYLTAGLDSRVTSLDINIYGADTEVGALSVEVTAHFKYPTGVSDTVSCYRTVILNKYEK